MAVFFLPTCFFRLFVVLKHHLHMGYLGKFLVFWPIVKQCIFAKKKVLYGKKNGKRNRNIKSVLILSCSSSLEKRPRGRQKYRNNETPNCYHRDSNPKHMHNP